MTKLNVTELTDSEIAFLQYSMESYEVYKKSHEMGYTNNFVQQAGDLEAAVFIEYVRRKLDWKQFTKEK